MKILALLSLAVPLTLAAFAVLSGCSGGGGGTAPEPSPDVRVTHPYLIGTWTGTATSSQAGAGVISLQVQINDVSGSLLDRFPCVVTFSATPCFTVLTGYVRPLGDTVDVQLGTVQVQGTVSLQFVVQGTYSVSAPGPCNGDTGTVLLQKQPVSHALLSTIETYESEDVFVRITTIRR